MVRMGGERKKIPSYRTIYLSGFDKFTPERMGLHTRLQNKKKNGKAGRDKGFAEQITSY